VDDETSRRLTVVPPGGGIPVVRLNGEETVLTVGDAETRGAYAARSAPLRRGSPRSRCVCTGTRRRGSSSSLASWPCMPGDVLSPPWPARSSWYRGGSCTRSPIGAGCRCAAHLDLPGGVGRVGGGRARPHRRVGRGPRPGPARGDPPPVRPGDRRAAAVVGLRRTAGGARRVPPAGRRGGRSVASPDGRAAVRPRGRAQPVVLTISS